MYFLELVLDIVRFFLRLIKLIELDGVISLVLVYGIMCFIYLLVDLVVNFYVV